MKIYLGILALLLFACNSSKKNNPEEKKTCHNSTSIKYLIPDKKGFQQTLEGAKVNLYLLKNKKNMLAAITNYGGRLVSLLVPNKYSILVDVSTGFKSIEEYKNSTEPYFGAIIGRYGNRIAKGKFNLDNKNYSLFTNNYPNTLHGGKNGFQNIVWNAVQIGDSILELTHLSRDMEEGFPGNLQVKVTYQLTHNNELKLTYEAITDKKTVLNLTNHAFFNLNGEGSGTINNHIFFINADRFTPVDSFLIPTGLIATVAKTSFDFRIPTTITKNINEKELQIKFGNGYDHNYILNANIHNPVTHAATVTGNKSKIKMDIFTTEPGLQFYSGNFMQSKNTIKSGNKDDFRTAFCLETQHFPNSPNQVEFPSTILDSGKIFKSLSIYKFSVSKEQ